MTKRLIYEFEINDFFVVNPNEVLATERRLIHPVVNCPMPNRGDRMSLEVCLTCDKCVDIHERYIECSYVQSRQDMDEIERKKKGMSVVNATPPPPPLKPNTEVKDPGKPKNVFTNK